MRAIRMDSELERRLQEAVRMTGETVSEFVRTATAARVDVVLRDDIPVEFADVIGAVHGGSAHGGTVAGESMRGERGQARDTGAAFTGMVAEKARSPRAAGVGRV